MYVLHPPIKPPSVSPAMHVLLFDIDGTLISSGGAGMFSLSKALAGEFGVADALNQVEVHGRTDRWIINEVFRLNSIDPTDENWNHALTVYLSLLDDGLKERQGHVLPGVVSLLEIISKRDDVVLGLLTGNSALGAEKKLTYFEIWHYFGFGAYGDHHESRDLIAASALEAAKFHLDRDVIHEQTWVIGDTPHDVRCAQAVGVRSIGVLTGGNSREEMAAAEPDVLLDDLTDPQAILSLL